MSKTIESLLILTGLSSCLFSCSPVPKSASPTPNAQAQHEHEHEHQEEGEVALSPEQIKLSGVVAEKVSFRDWRPSLRLPATLAADADLEAHISARAAGVITRLLVRQGDSVQAGQTLAVVDSPEVAQLRSQFLLLATSTQLAQSNLERRLSLSQLGDTTRRPFEEAQRELAQARNGEKSAQANFELQRQKLARLQELEKDGIASKQLVDEARAAFREAQARLDQAKLDLQVAGDHMRRESKLQQSGVLRDNEAYQAQAELTRHRQEQQAAAEVLASFGARPEGRGGEVEVTSPIQGIVTERSKALGEQVAQGESLVRVVDTRRLWAWVDLNREWLATTSPNKSAQVISREPRLTRKGRLTWIHTLADAETKRVRARVEFDNPGGQLRPNGLVEVVLPQGAPRKVLAVPAAAVVSIENQSVVYLQEEPGHFHRHPVEIGQRQDSWVEIRSGLEAGALVVSRGALALQAADLKSLMGGAGGHQH